MELDHNMIGGMWHSQDEVYCVGEGGTELKAPFSSTCWLITTSLFS